MMAKKKYISPLCIVNEMEPQMMMVGTSTMKVESSQALMNVGGDVNRNEDYDIWNNSSDMWP